jgi:hypothetical protein
MKTVYNVVLASALIAGISSCSSFKDLSKQKNGDDLYFSMKDAKKERAAEKKRKEEEAKKKEEEARQRQIQENNAKAMATSPGTDYYNEPFDYDDYYDYEYAARLRRFNHPVAGNGYYGNYYTNSYYYNQNPNYYGTSVYNSYPWWGPSSYAYNYCPSSYFYYNSGWPWGTGMYYGNSYGYNPYGYYDPWMNGGWGYNPYYSYGPGWNGGWYGPMTPIYANYWGGPFLGWSNGNGGYGYGGFGNNNNYYFNSFDQNSYYYGPRRTATSTDGRPVGSGGPAFGERFASNIAAENNLSSADIQQVNQVVGVVPAAHTAPSATSAPVQSSSPVMRPETAPVMTPSSGVPAPPVSNSQPVQSRTDGSTPPAPVFTNSGSSQPASAPTTTPRNDAPAPNYNLCSFRWKQQQQSCTAQFGR